MNIAIITACPSGVANSILAAGLLEQAAAKLTGMQKSNVNQVWLNLHC